MPSYLSYMRQMAVMDADDDNIESWITVRGNHIPIMKGQSKEDAVKSFIAGKKKNLVENHNSLVEAMNLEEKGYFKKDPKKRESITQSAIEMGKEEKNLEELMEFGVKEGNAAKPESKKGGKQTFYKNVSGKQIGSPKGRTFIENEIMTEKEMAKRGFDPTDKRFERKELGKNEHHFFFGARFENEKPESKKGGSEEKVDNEKIKKAINKVAVAVNERKADEKTSIKNLTKEMGLNESETQKLNEFFGTGEGKAKYPTEFETVRKNAKANPYLYDLRYTQKSKAKAYEEYKKDTEKKESAGEQHTTTRNIMTLFSKHYEDLYDGKTKSNRELVKEFDDKMANDPEFKKQVQAFVRERGDVLSSDREVQAYMMAYNTTKSKLEPAMKKLERAHGQTIAQLKETGKDISKLQQAMQHINYGFYEEQGKNMTPNQLVDYLQGEIDKSYGKKDYYSSRVQTRYPEAIKLVKEYIND